MHYQILRQSRSGEPWEFVAHGARYETKADAERTIDLIKRNTGAKTRLLPVGKPGGAKVTESPWELISTTKRAIYWHKPGVGYLAFQNRGAPTTPAPDGKSGYPRLTSLMRMKGEKESTINRVCNLETGKHKVQAQ